MTPLILSTRRPTLYFQTGDVGYYLDAAKGERMDLQKVLQNLTQTGKADSPSRWIRFVVDDITGEGMFCARMDSPNKDGFTTLSCGVASPFFLTESEMKWAKNVAEKYGYNHKKILEDQGDADAFRLLAFLEVAHFRMRLEAEKSPHQTPWFDAENFLDALATVVLE